MNIWQIVLIFAACFVISDLISPTIYYLYCNIVEFIRNKLKLTPSTRAFAEHIYPRTYEEISRIKPPKSIYYLRYFWSIYFRKGIFYKRKEMVQKFYNNSRTILGKNVTVFVKCPFFDFGINGFAKAFHLKRIIRRLLRYVYHKQTEPYSIFDILFFYFSKQYTANQLQLFVFCYMLT